MQVFLPPFMARRGSHPLPKMIALFVGGRPAPKMAPFVPSQPGPAQLPSLVDGQHYQRSQGVKGQSCFPQAFGGGVSTAPLTHSSTLGPSSIAGGRSQ